MESRRKISLNFIRKYPKDCKKENHLYFLHKPGTKNELNIIQFFKLFEYFIQLS